MTERLRWISGMLAVLIVSSVLVATRSAAQGPAALPTPEQFFGFQMGADRKLANWDRLLDYYRRLDAGSDRMTLVELGRSSEDRPFIALYISSPANLAALEPLRQNNLRLSDPRGLSESEARTLARSGRAVVVQSFALHSSEVAAAQTAAEFVHDSLTREDADAARIRDEVISIVLPSINPDGTQMIADWYNKYAGTEYEAAGLPWLYQKYAGHDNNRDAFQMNLPESQHVARVLFREWIPQAFVDHHQMGNGNARMYIPPYADPVRPSADPLVWREIAWWGAHMGYLLEEAGKTGIIGDAIYSGWGHMGFHWITPFHNIAGMLTESASARLATPINQPRESLRGGPRNLPAYEEQTNMPSLWPGGWWRVRDIVEQQKIAAFATLDLAARNRELVLWNAYQKAKRQTERGAAGETKAYVIPAAQHDTLTAVKMVNKLLDQGVEIHRASRSFTAGGTTYDAGSFIVPMAQPKMGVVRWMLGQTFYPDNTYTRDRANAPIRPYDMSTDTMTEFMGVRSDPIREAVAPDTGTRLTAHVKVTGRSAASPAGYALDGRLNDSFVAVNRLLARNVPVRRLAVAAAGRRAGDFLVAGGHREAVDDAATATGVDFTPLAAAITSGAFEIRPPRIALYQRYGGGNMDEGWTRLMLEQFQFPFTSAMDRDIRAGNLNAKYDVIVLPSDSVSSMAGQLPPMPGAPAAGRGGGGRGRGAAQGGRGEGAPQAAGRGAEGGRTGGEGGGRGNQGGGTPPEYRNNGIGVEGVDALRRFVEAGGTLVTFAQAGDLPIQRFGLPLRNVVDGLSSVQFWCPGSTLKIGVDPSHPLTFGLPDAALATFLAGSQVYEVTDASRAADVDVLARYADKNVLQSGWLIGEPTIAGKAAAVSVRLGQGRVVLLGFRAQHRAQTHGTYKFVFNALVNGPPISSSAAARR
jgi:hypothetical protein